MVAANIDGMPAGGGDFAFAPSAGGQFCRVRFSSLSTYCCCWSSCLMPACYRWFWRRARAARMRMARFACTFTCGWREAERRLLSIIYLSRSFLADQSLRVRGVLPGRAHAARLKTPFLQYFSQYIDVHWSIFLYAIFLLYFLYIL